MLPSDGCPETVSRVQIMVMHYERARRDLASAAAVPHARIGGYACPRLIVGGWQLSAGHSAGRSATPAADLATAAARGMGAVDFGDIYTGVHLGDDISEMIPWGWGVAHFGGMYTGVERLVGGFVRDHVGYGRRRASLRLHTKLVPDLRDLASFGAAEVRAVVLRSCGRLRTDFVDLVQFHWWDLSVRRYVG